MRIYTDNCCIGRRFDDQSQERIRLETRAIEYIQLCFSTNRLEFAWSFVLDIEGSVAPDLKRRNENELWAKYAQINIQKSAEIVEVAKNLANCGLKYMDALHIACACAAKCDYFITVDDGILKKNLPFIKTINPTNFVEEVLKNEN